MASIVKRIREELIKNSNLKTKQQSKNFFKERVKTFGVKTAIVRKISKEYFKKIQEKNKNEIFSLCKELWQSGYLEESFIACHWSFSINKSYQLEDFKVFEQWVGKYINNWASCDTFCNYTVGKFIEIYPEYIFELKKWTKSKNKWVRRASAASLIVSARKGLFLKDIFEISDALLLDKDDMVQKGYGWLLKVASQKHQDEVFNYVMKNKIKMPRTSLRYAIEKMPKELKEKAMKK